MARFGAVVVLNEEARAAVPALDLIPDPGEDALATLRSLPVPYLWGGFAKLDVGDPDRPWARTFANHRLGLPDLATHLTGHAETGRTFQLFAGLLGYLTQMQETFAAGDVLDLGDAKLRLREPAEAEWYLESPGPLLVVETRTMTTHRQFWSPPPLRGRVRVGGRLPEWGRSLTSRGASPPP